MSDSSDFNLGYVITRKLFENICLRDHLRTWKKNILKVSYNTGIRGGSRTAATSKMELFVIIVNGWI